MKDLELRDPHLYGMVKEESRRQIAKWGIQDHDPFEWITHTTEELGELSCAISEWTYRGGLQSEVVKEAIHTATLCLKIAEMFIELYDEGDKSFEERQQNEEGIQFCNTMERMIDKITKEDNHEISNASNMERNLRKG